MNIKAAYRYQLEDNKKSLLVFYLILITIYILALFSFAIIIISEDGTSSGSIGAMEISSVIFIFVTGLCSFKETFGMLMQNGVSRKTLFISHCYNALTIAFIMATIDKILFLIFKTISAPNSDSPIYISLFEQLYPMAEQNLGGFALPMLSYLFNFLLYFAFLAAGYLITLIYYRLGNAGKIALSVSVPVGILFVLPIVDYQFANGRISAAFVKFTDFSLGITANQPTNALITFALAAILFSAFSWLLIRRALVNK